MKRAVSWCLLVLLSCVSLVACGTGPAGPSPSPPPTTPASATASPLPSAVAKPVYKPATATSKALNVPVPVMPEAAKKETPEGAKAFVEYWVAMLSYAYETGDVTTLKKLSTSACNGCQASIASIERAYSNGGWLEGGQVRLAASEVRSVAGRQQAIIVAQLIERPATVHRLDGQATRYQASDSAYAYVVKWAAGKLTIADSGLITK